MAGGDVIHTLFKLRRHLGIRDMRRELAQSIDHRHAKLAWLDGVVLNVIDRVQALDDRMARRLRSKAELLHLLDELALAVTRRRLGLLLGARSPVEGNHLPLGERGQLLVPLKTVRVNGTETRLYQNVALSRKRLTCNIERHLGALDDGSIRQRCQESACNEVVELVFSCGQIVRRGLRGRVNGRMVGGLLLAARGRKLAPRKQLLAHRRIRGISGNGPDHLGEIERARVHRVVHTGIRDIAIHVKALSKAHRASRGKTLGRSRSQERRRIEGSGRRNLAALGLNGIHASAHRGRNRLHDGLSRSLVLEASGAVQRLERTFPVTGSRTACGIGIEGALDHPVILGNEGHALALALNDEGQRRGLNATGRTHVAVAGELHERQIARQHGAPDKVDVLTRCAGLSQAVVHAHQVLEGVGDLSLRKRGVARTGNGSRRVYLATARKSVGPDELSFTVEVGCDHDGIGLLGKVLERSDDVFFLGKLLDGRIHQVRKRIHLPRLKLYAIFREGLALLKGRLGKRSGDAGGKRLAVGSNAHPTTALLVNKLRREIGLENVAAQADGDPLLAVALKAINGR